MIQGWIIRMVAFAALAMLVAAPAQSLTIKYSNEVKKGIVTLKEKISVREDIKDLFSPEIPSVVRVPIKRDYRPEEPKRFPVEFPVYEPPREYPNVVPIVREIPRPSWPDVIVPIVDRGGYNPFEPFNPFEGDFPVPGRPIPTRPEGPRGPAGAVPEPSAALLFASSFVALAGMRKRN